MRRSHAALFLLAALPGLTWSQDFKMEPGAKSPEDSLRCIKLRPGFKAELMVAEPLVKSPIAFAWGADGKFWVVEMGDYPLGIDGKGKPGGRIKFLEKSRPDGPYDRMTVFMDNLGFPTGVMPYGKGVLVTCAPDIFYAEDTDGDGKADKKEVLFTGFIEGNQQHRVNGLTWGMDNWIYGANGDSGGKIKSLKTGIIVDIRGRDFRFKVETGAFEAQSGQSQFGRCHDDWGNWFGNNNSNPMYHYVLDDTFLKRNPHVLYPETRVPVSIKPGAAEVFPISKPMPRFNSPQALNHFTSACSTIVYRDTLFGPAFEGNMFVSEPVHNLIHREIMKRKGATFTSHRADDEQTSEFLASSDNWFRPTTIQTGPDGALWVADMYRYVIEHPQWIPKDWQEKLDLRAGQDKGRIYRIYPTDKKPRPIVRMDAKSVKELASLLESPNGPTRDLAHLLLVQLKASAEALKDVESEVLPILRKSKMPQARLHALSVLDGIGHLPKDEYKVVSQDEHPAVRRRALRVFSIPTAEAQKFLKDDDLLTRLEFGYVLGEGKTDGNNPLLARYLIENAGNPYLLAAGLSSVSETNWAAVSNELMKQTNSRLPGGLFGHVMRLTRAYSKSDVSRLLTSQLSLLEELPRDQQILVVSELLENAAQSGLTLANLMDGKDANKTFARIRDIHATALKVLAESTAPVAERMIAVRLLNRGLADDRADQRVLLSQLTPRTSDALQSSAIQQLGGTKDPRLPGLLLAPWKSYSPKLRGEVLDVLLSRPIWVRMTLDALEKKQVPSSEIDAIRRQRLLHHPDESVRVAATKVFASSTNRDRARIADEYWLRLPDKADRERGAKLFAKSCASCHQLGGVGQQVGPDLASVGDKSPQALLIAILDPNRAVEARYINYLAVTKAGLTFTGILTSETSTTLSLVGPDGKQHQLLRNELDDLTSTGKSMMPEGLEKDLAPQDLADVIEFIRVNLPAKKLKEFPGNVPATVHPDKKGELHLLPKNAAIYGPKIILEPQHGNLGWWSSPEDHAVWKVESPEAGTYIVWIDYACANDSAGNRLAIRGSGDSRLLYTIAGTGSWDDYRTRKIGDLQLQSGAQAITLRAEGTLRGALLDLRGVKLTLK